MRYDNRFENSNNKEQLHIIKRIARKAYIKKLDKIEFPNYGQIDYSPLHIDTCIICGKEFNPRESIISKRNKVCDSVECRKTWAMSLSKDDDKINYHKIERCMYHRSRTLFIFININGSLNCEKDFVHIKNNDLFYLNPVMINKFKELINQFPYYKLIITDFKAKEYKNEIVHNFKNHGIDIENKIDFTKNLSDLKLLNIDKYIFEHRKKCFNFVIIDPYMNNNRIRLFKPKDKQGLTLNMVSRIIKFIKRKLKK